MSTGAPAPLRPNTRLSPAARWGAFLWLLLVVVCGVSFWFTSETASRNSLLSRELNDTRDRVEELQKAIQQGPQTLKTQIGQIETDAKTLNQKLQSVEQVMDFYKGKFETLEDRSSAAESRQAVQRAEVAILATQVKAARERLQKLKTLDAAWRAQTASLMSGDSGRRVVSSPTHLDLVESLLAQGRATDLQLQQWTIQLEALAPPVEAAAKDQKSQIMILPEHAKQLADLAQALVAAESSSEQQSLLLTAYLRETAGQAAHAKTLDAVLQERRQIAQRSQQDRLRAAQKAARDTADQQEVSRLEQLEKDLGQERLKAHELARRQDEERVRQRERDEEERKAQEARVEQAAHKARNQGLKAEADRAEEALRLAQLSREFDRVLPEARTLLAAFITPGFKHRTNGTKGPVALSYIQSRGALERTEQGRDALRRLAVSGNDRPLGAQMDYSATAFSVSQEAQWRPVERAQEILVKYGEVLVQRGLLDP